MYFTMTGQECRDNFITCSALGRKTTRAKNLLDKYLLHCFMNESLYKYPFEWKNHRPLCEAASKWMSEFADHLAI